MMERHKCKLCSRSFTNGRALGGHMKAHLAATTHSVSASFSYSSDSQQEEEEEEEKSLIYALRENPKKSLKLAAPDAASLVQDRESETESKTNPTRQRSKRNRRSSAMLGLSSEEHVAMCLMMLSRDTWNAAPPKRSRTGSKHLCHACNKAFRSSRALATHATVCRNTTHDAAATKLFECPFCYKLFGSGQALGGHKRSHLVPSSTDSVKFKHTFIDLNLPAPPEDDNLSVVSDGSGYV